MLFPLKVDCSEIEQKRSGIMETQYKNDMIREIESLIQLEMEKSREEAKREVRCAHFKAPGTHNGTEALER